MSFKDQSCILFIIENLNKILEIYYIIFKFNAKYDFRFI